MRYCKSTIFQANHNRFPRVEMAKSVVCDTAKVRFFKQITTSRWCSQWSTRCLRYCKSTIFQANHNKSTHLNRFKKLFAILQKYDFSSKSQPVAQMGQKPFSCLRYCKSTIFQANHNQNASIQQPSLVVCDTAKVRFFKQITTVSHTHTRSWCCLRYCKSTIFQANHNDNEVILAKIVVVCDTAKVRFFKQITTAHCTPPPQAKLFAILQKYDFSSKSQHSNVQVGDVIVVCDTAKVRFFKQITTPHDQRIFHPSCLRYCKSTIFQANHNSVGAANTANLLFAILQKYDFSSKSQRVDPFVTKHTVVCDTAKVRFFKQITTPRKICIGICWLFAILQKYDFSSKSQLGTLLKLILCSCLRYCKSTIFQANHNMSMRGVYEFLLFAILQKYDFSSKSQR